MLKKIHLSKQSTRLANQRTYLSYMRTGFAIASVAGAFKKIWISLFGVIMIIGSLVQYIMINESINQNKNPYNKYLNYFPVIYVVLSLGALYLQMKK